MFAFDQVGAIQEEAEKIILAEREEWASFYEVIENYVASSSAGKALDEGAIFIGGSLGVDLLLKKPRTLSDYVYFLYSQQALKHANNLTNLLAEMVAKVYGSLNSILDRARKVYAGKPNAKELASLREPRLVMMKTALPYQRYLIYVDSRLLVQFTSLPKGSAAIVAPVLSETFDGKNQVMVISPEVQLLDIYRVLYSPAKVGEWREALRDENNLYQHLKQRLPELSNGKVTKLGGEEDEITGAAESENLRNYKFTLLSEWIQNNPRVVLIGEYALQMMSPELTQGKVHAMLQVISANPEEEAAQVCEILRQKHQVKCQHTTRPLTVMQDFRLTRTSVRVEEKEILYLYNCGAYDLVPFNQAFSGKLGGRGAGKNKTQEKAQKDTQKNETRLARFIQVGNPFVVLRFLLVDFWTVRLLLAENRIDAKYAELRLGSIIKLLLGLRHKISTLEGKEQTATIGDKFLGEGGLLRTFALGTENYFGAYEDEVQAQKNLLNQGARRFNDYYPDEALRREGQYREIEKQGGYESRIPFYVWDP